MKVFATAMLALLVSGSVVVVAFGVVDGRVVLAVVVVVVDDVVVVGELAATQSLYSSRLELASLHRWFVLQLVEVQLPPDGDLA